MLGVMVVPAVLYGLLSFAIPESPRFLISVGKKAEARKILEEVEGDKIDLDARVTEIETAMHREHKSSFKDLLGNRFFFLPIVWVGIGLSMFQQLVGINVALRTLLREELITLLGPDFDREVKTEGGAETPGVVGVGVNGTGKTTTTGKLARVLVADGRSVVLGAADTFRAAAADQLQTWGERVGARTVRGPEGGDPASIAYDAVKEGIAEGADVVLIGTAQAGCTPRPASWTSWARSSASWKARPAGRGAARPRRHHRQNGLVQARVFAEVVDITGIVLTKLDGTAKGGIVIAVQRELGVPVKLIGLGEGPDDLAPFEPGAFVDALIGD
ncbi:Signal recognition particle receptor FtsY [Streptomyces badius]